MPRIRILEAIAGSDFSWGPGDVVEVSEEAAANWADGHRAVLADDGQDGGRVPSAVHQEPLVVGEDGQALEVVAATLEDVEPSAGAEGGPRWVRWSVTVRLPAPAAPAAAPEPGEREPADPADLENQDPQEQPVPPFHPDEHSNREVLAYLDGVGEQEALRVLETEAAGQNRAGIGKNREAVLEAARARDRAANGGQVENAADFSRGGGAAETPETRSW
ncbi:hypothetical protein ACFW91_24910 [Streptomyces asoensis]|uniref:hypothetical protein n=1 Tax=Streptomyces asoensis TaxID=249586 RepID=UPI0036C1C24B